MRFYTNSFPVLFTINLPSAIYPFKAIKTNRIPNLNTLIFVIKYMSFKLLKLKIMKNNMSSYDKLIRLGLSIVLIILYYKQVITGTFGIICLVVALLLTLTSLISFCPIYKILGISTCKTKKE